MYAHIGTNIIICTFICMYFRGEIMGAKKDFILQVRLNEYELELLDKYAKDMYMNRSDYVRYCMMRQRLTEGMKGED